MDISEIFKGRILTILKFFLMQPSLEASRSTVREKLKLSKTTAVKHLDFLVENGILLEKPIGTTKLVRLNNDSILVKEIKKFFILAMVQPFELKNAEVYLFGSTARGEYSDDSDVDLLIIGKIHKSEVIEKIEKLEKKIKRKINLQIFTPQEWSTMAKKDKAFYERVEKDKILLNQSFE